MKELRCPNCHKLLMRVEVDFEELHALMYLEHKCPRCKDIVKFKGKSENSKKLIFTKKPECMTPVYIRHEKDFSRLLISFSVTPKKHKIDLSSKIRNFVDEITSITGRYFN